MEKQRISSVNTISFLMLIGIFATVFLAGCGKQRPTDERNELVILCGNSFVKPTEQLYAQFTAKTGIKVVTTIGGSEDLLPHVKLRQQGDIFITHDPYLDYTRDANALADHTQAGFVAPVLATQKGNPKGVKSINDLTRPGLKVALTDPKYSTCGEMVFALLEKKGIKDAVLKNVGNRLTRGHSDLGTYLKTQTVDAVIMWNGVAHTFRDSLQVVPAPYEYDEEIRVHIIGLNYSKQPESVRQFIEFARQKGPTIFAEYGYVK